MEPSHCLDWFHLDTCSSSEWYELVHSIIFYVGLLYLLFRREALIKSYPFASEIKKRGIRSFFSNRRKKKVFYHGLSQNQTFGVGDELPTYEDVIRFEPSPDVIRPIVLIGAPGVGRRTLIRKLLNSNTSCYMPIIQCKYWAWIIFYIVSILCMLSS